MQKLAGVLAAVVFFGCPTSSPPVAPPPGFPGSTTSSTTSGGGGIPLDELCAVLHDKMLNYYVDALAWQYASARDGLNCPDGLDFAETQLLYTEYYALYFEKFCEPGTYRYDPYDPYSYYRGYGTLWVQAIASSEQRGRVNYDEQAAGECVRLGEEADTAAGSRYNRFQRALGDGGVADASAPPVCVSAVHGLQGEGEPCRGTLECDETQKLLCTGPLNGDCDRTCRRPATVGQPCGNGEPDCESGLNCVYTDDEEPGQCQAGIARYQPCRFDGGVTRNCASGLVCLSGGICDEPLGEGTGCAQAEDCEPGLQCMGVPPRCARPGGEGARCDNGTCSGCLYCHHQPGSDAGSFCRTPVGEGEPCGFAPCIYSLACVDGVCAPRVELGESCRFLDDAGMANCKNWTAVCAGDPPTCQFPGLEGASCSAPATGRAVSGSCRAGLVCARTSETATQGVCKGAGKAAGDLCGDQYDRHPGCFFDYLDYANDYASSFYCRITEPDAGRGQCTPYGRLQPGAECTASTSGLCPERTYCNVPDAGGMGHCDPGAGLNELCRTRGYQCSEGYCQYGGADAGYEYVCRPGRTLGQACDYSNACAAPLFCKRPDDGGYVGTCVNKLGAGEPCTYVSDCAEGYTCSDEVCTPEACFSAENYGYSCVGGEGIAYILFYGVMFGGYRWRRRQTK